MTLVLLAALSALIAGFAWLGYRQERRDADAAEAIAAEERRLEWCRRMGVEPSEWDEAMAQLSAGFNEFARQMSEAFTPVVESLAASFRQIAAVYGEAWETLVDQYGSKEAIYEAAWEVRRGPAGEIEAVDLARCPACPWFVTTDVSEERP